MDMIGKIRRMHFRQNKSAQVIARSTGLSRNTVRTWLRQPGDVVPRYAARRTQPSRKLAPYVEWLRQAVAMDAQRAVAQRRTARALHAELKRQGYDGAYSRVTDLLRAWRQADGTSAVHAFVPLTFALGEAFQFDWSEESMVVGGVPYRVQVAHVKLCASRAFWLGAYPSQGHEMLFDAHTQAFAAFGGVPHRGIYDNMKTAVDKVHPRKKRDVNARFAAMCSHDLFDPDFCNVASGWEKGVVEKNVQDSRRRVWIEALSTPWRSFAELNAWLAMRCRALWQEIFHPEFSQFTVAEMLEHEQPHLMPMPTAFDGYVDNTVKVSSTCLVAMAGNRYSVPCELAGRRVSTRVYPTEVVVVHDGVCVAHHARLANRGQTPYDWQHDVPLIQRKPGALRNGAPVTDRHIPASRESA